MTIPLVSEGGPLDHDHQNLLVNKANYLDGIVADLLAPIYCRLSQTGTMQSIPNGSNTVVLFNNEIADPFGLHSTVTNTGRITFTLPGQYHGRAQVQYPSSGTGLRDLQPRINGSGIGWMVRHLGNSASTWAMVTSFDFTVSVAGDYLDLITAQVAGSSQTLVSAYLSVQRYSD